MREDSLPLWGVLIGMVLVSGCVDYLLERKREGARLNASICIPSARGYKPAGTASAPPLRSAFACSNLGQLSASALRLCSAPLLSALPSLALTIPPF